VPFLPFSLVEAAVVTHKFVLELKTQVLQSVKVSGKRLVGHIVLELRGDGAICKAIAKEGYDCDQGARSLQSSVETRIGDCLVRTYLEEEEQIDDSSPIIRYTVSLTRNGNIVVRKSMGPTDEGPKERKEKQNRDELKARKEQHYQETQKKTPEQDQEKQKKTPEQYQIPDVENRDFAMLNLLWHIDKTK
jgi:hypothetical protein